MAKDKITITFVGKDLERQINRALKRNPVATVKAVRGIAIGLAGESARRAPIESGDLRNNCSAELNDVTIFEKKKKIPAVTLPATEAIASVGYSLPYALRQHEELKYRHDRIDGYRRADGTTVNKVAGGEAKYLERPYNENEVKYIERIMRIPKEVLK